MSKVKPSKTPEGKGIQASVACAVGNMYDRFMEVQLAAGRPGCDAWDFMNQIIFRGMIAYGPELAEAEKLLGITEDD